eukprot:SAG31_NODE_765_length_12248_cov_6.802947_18_plen_116_part_00
MWQLGSINMDDHSHILGQNGDVRMCDAKSSFPPVLECCIGNFCQSGGWIHDLLCLTPAVTEDAKDQEKEIHSTRAYERQLTLLFIARQESGLSTAKTHVRVCSARRKEGAQNPAR